MNTTRTALRRTWTLGILGGLALGACAGGPERAPHQPIQGVDTEKTEVDNPHDQPERTGRGGAAALVPAPRPPVAEPAAPSGAGPAAVAPETFLDEFLDQVAAAHGAAPGTIAVFPALSRTPASREARVTGLGELLMQETADGLEARGVTGVVAGPGLVAELRNANRGLRDLGGVEDVAGIADRIGVSYVIFGSADVRDLERMDRDQSLDVRWTAQRRSDGATVASYRQRLAGGALARYLFRHHQTPGELRIGSDATGYRPSLQLEARILSRLLVRKLAADQSDRLRGSAVRVEPTVLTARSGARAGLQEWSAEFARKLDVETRRLAREGGNGDPVQTALDQSPTTIQGREYASFGDATDAFRSLRNNVDTSATGDLENDIATSITEHLRSALQGDIRILAGEAQREAILDVIRREARAARADDAVDALTIARLRAHGTQLLVTSSLRLDLENYTLRLTLLDLSSGETFAYSEVFGQQFKNDLDRALGR